MQLTNQELYYINGGGYCIGITTSGAAIYNMTRIIKFICSLFIRK